MNHENPATTYQATLGTEDPKTVNEAKQLDDWPEWEKAIKAELDQLNNLGTWELVECPKDAILIPNKWVFIKKYNNEAVLFDAPQIPAGIQSFQWIPVEWDWNLEKLKKIHRNGTGICRNVTGIHRNGWNPPE